MGKHTVVILDFSTGDVHIAPYDISAYEDFFDFLVDFNEHTGYNLKQGNCQWMIMEKINIEIHN